MSLRQAYKMVIKNELENCDEVPQEKVNELVDALSDNYDFLTGISEYVKQHLKDFGENYGLWGN